MKARIITGAVVGALALTAPWPTSAEAGSDDWVIDGDTVVVDHETIRLQGIDTPEHGEPCYDQATADLRALFARGEPEVTRREGTDRYGRTIGYVSVNGIDAGTWMLRRGKAVARYDGTDGYASHPKQGAYRSAERSTICTTHGDSEQPERGGVQTPGMSEPDTANTAPFWTAAALVAWADAEGVRLDLDLLNEGGRFTDVSSHRATHEVRTAVFFREAERLEQERLEQERRRSAEAEARQRRSSSASSSSSRGRPATAAPCRAYDPGGKTFKYIDC